MSDSDTTSSSLAELTAAVATAYVGRNTVSVRELPDLIRSISDALAGHNAPAKDLSRSSPPAVPIRKSVTDDHIFCLEDGKPFKSLKEHLRVRHKLSADEYRAKWGLPQDYPMTAPTYSAVRIHLAKSMGLGKKGSHRRRRLSGQTRSTNEGDFDVASRQPQPSVD